MWATDHIITGPLQTIESTRGQCLDSWQRPPFRPAIILRPELLPARLFASENVLARLVQQQFFRRRCPFRESAALQLLSDSTDAKLTFGASVFDKFTAVSWRNVVVGRRRQDIVVALDGRRPETDPPLVRQEGSERDERIRRWSLAKSCCLEIKIQNLFLLKLTPSFCKPWKNRFSCQWIYTY